MDTARYKALIASVETGSFTGAAKQLNYTPSGVSQLVSALEKELGFTLLNRKKQGVELTENGQYFLPAIRELISQENRIFSMAAELNGLMVGSITIAAYSSIATHWLPEVLREFQRDYPQIKVKLMEGIRQEVVGWIQDKTADIAFMSYQEPMIHADWIPLRDDSMLAVLPVNHPFAKEKSYPLENCKYEKFIMPALGKDDDVLHLFAENDIKPNIQFTTLENFAAMALIEQGLGMSVMNELITKGWQCDVVKLPLTKPAYISLGAAIPSLKQATPAVKKFLEYTKKIIK